MSKPALGTKRVCPKCTAKFYDFSRSRIECPKCGHTYLPEGKPKPGNVKEQA